MYNTLTELMTAIADAIRTKTGKTHEIIVETMPEEILSIETEPLLQDKTFTENGIYTADLGYDGLRQVTVDVQGGGEGPKLKNLYNFCNCTYYGLTSAELIEFIKSNVSQAPLGMHGAFNSTQFVVALCDLELVHFVFSYFDFSMVEDLGYSFNFRVITNLKGLDNNITTTMNLSNCTSMDQAFNFQNNGNVPYSLDVDFNGTTKLVSDFRESFKGSTNLVGPQQTLKIRNIAMDEASSVIGMFGTSEVATPRLQKLTFQGAFGLTSTTNTMTLDLSRIPAADYGPEQAKETLRSVSATASGKTRIFKLSAQNYAEVVADAELVSELTAKNYQLASA